MFFKKRENDGGEKQIVMTLSESRIRGENAFGQKMMVTWYFHGQSQRDRARIFNRGRELVDPNDSQTFSLSFPKKKIAPESCRLRQLPQVSGFAFT